MQREISRCSTRLDRDSRDLAKRAVLLARARHKAAEVREVSAAWCDTIARHCSRSCRRRRVTTAWNSRSAIIFRLLDTHHRVTGDFQSRAFRSCRPDRLRNRPWYFREAASRKREIDGSLDPFGLYPRL